MSEANQAPGSPVDGAIGELLGGEADPAETPPVGLFVLTAFLGLLVFLDVLITRGQPLWGLPWRPAVIAAVVGGVRVTFASLRGAFAGEIGADLALAVATWAALAIGEPVAAAEVVFIAMTGESLEEMAFARTAKALSRLLSLRPRTARVLLDGLEVELPSGEVPLGATVIVRPGERVAVDGIVLEGSTSVDESTLTGESVPVDRAPGDEVFSGTQNLYGTIRVRTEKVGADTTLGQVVELVRQAEEQKAPVQRTADLYASYFLPAVLAAAALTLWLTRDWYRTVAVLVVACPCALVLATPAAVLAGIGRLARLGVLVKGGEALESMARVRTLAFDKTGTLTLGKLELADLVPLGGASEAELLAVAAAAESGSEHPLGKVIVEAARARELALETPVSQQTTPGAGLVAEGLSGRLAVGNRRLMDSLGIPLSDEANGAATALATAGQTVVFAARGESLLGLIGARDRLREDAPRAMAALHGLGFGRIALLTGDRPQVAETVAREVGIDEVHAEQLPADKADWVRTRRNAGERVAMIGDGINDAPALAAAEVGIAVAETGSDLSAEAADIVLLGDPLAQLPELVRISRQVLFTIRLSIIGFAFALNGTAVLLSAFGQLSPVQAAIFHQVGSLAVLLNSLRLLGFEPRPGSRLARVGSGLQRGIAAALSLDIDGFVGGLAARWRPLLKLTAAVALLGWALSCLVWIGPDQIAVVRVLGRHRATFGPGVALKPWWPFGRATLLRPAEVKSLELGFRSTSTRGRPRLLNASYDWNSAHLSGAFDRVGAEALMLTGDENFVEAQAVIQYRIQDPEGYLFGVADVGWQLRAAAEEVLRRQVAETSLEAVLTVERQAVEEAVRASLQRACEARSLALAITAVELGDVHPPGEVVPAFRAVSSAFENREQKINEAEAYANEQAALAAGEAAALRAEAEAYRAARVSRAKGEADRFRNRRVAAGVGPQVTRVRLYLETVERVLSGRRLMVLDPLVAARRQFWIVDPQRADALKLLTALPPATSPETRPELPSESGALP